MVSIDVMPQYCLSSKAAIVITMIATSEPGIFLLNRGVSVIITMLTMPTIAVHQSIVLMSWK